MAPPIPAAMGAAGEAYANVTPTAPAVPGGAPGCRTWRTVVRPFDGCGARSGNNLAEAVFGPSRPTLRGVAALLSGELDLIYPVPIQDVARVERNDGTYVLSGPENRSLF